MSAAVMVWLGALAFLTCAIVGFGRLYRVSAKSGEDIAFLFVGGCGLLGICGIVLGPAYYLARAML